MVGGKGEPLPNGDHVRIRYAIHNCNAQCGS
jgi:hypothetical protein